MLAIVSAPTVGRERIVPGPAALRTLARGALAVGVFAVFVSMSGAWRPSLWGDEAASLMSAMRPLGSLFAMLGHLDAVHGTYYLGLHGWIRLFGITPFAARVPSALAMGVCAAGVAWVSGRFRGWRFGVAAGVVAAVLPRLTYAGLDVRSYAFSAALATLLVAIVGEIVLRTVPDPHAVPDLHGAPRLRRAVGLRWWVAYAVVLAVGIYVFLYTSLMALAIGAALVAIPDLRTQLRRWFLATAGGVLAAAPVVWFGIVERHQIGFLSHRNEINAQSVLVTMWFGSIWFALLAWALVVVAVIELAVSSVRRGRSLPPETRLGVLAAAWLFIPVGLLVAASAFASGYTSRYGTFAAPAAAILMVAGMSRLGKLAARRRWNGAGRWLPAVTFAAVVALALPIWAAQRGPYGMGSDWNQITATVSARAQPGDAVLFDHTRRPSKRPRLALDTNPTAYIGLHDVLLRTPYAHRTTWYDSVYSIPEAAARGRFDGIDRLWVVEYRTASGKADRWGLAALTALGYHRVGSIGGHRHVVLEYSR
jgi:mannosyltransferase